ncbi:MAG: arylsulfatase [Verrucomicrobiales bacterium VVV1]|nr:MAG: arylsulfatase [Verrucomicrobiales bacterium VVV1]
MSCFLRSLLVVLACLAPPLAAAAPPNVLLILADDLGFSDLGCYGGEIPTPHLDGLARDGLRYTTCYTSARCCPSRASLITGLHPHQAGIGSFATAKPERGKSAAYTGHLLPDTLTLPEALKAGGYSTWMVGKWHMGHPGPIARGFDQFYGIKNPLSHSESQWEPQAYARLPEGTTPEITRPEGTFFATDVFTDYALEFLKQAREQKDKPWFLYLAHSAPHFPLMAPAEDIAKYRGKYKGGWDKLREERHAKQLRLGLLDKAWSLTPRAPDVKAWDSLTADEQDRFDNLMAIYAACVDRMDQAVGKLVANLKSRGELDNTLILFMSDNGGNAEAGINGRSTGPGEPGSAESDVFCGESWANLQNTPFRLYKHFNHEGGISSPLIAHWPAGIPAKGEFRQQPGHLIDIMATCVAVSGAKYPTEFKGQPILPMEGKSLLPAFANKPIDRDAIFWEHEGNAAVRAGDMKLVRKGRKGEWELYDLKTDRTELHDLANQKPEVAKQLAAKWDAWATRAHVLPYPNQEASRKSTKAPAAGE